MKYPYHVRLAVSQYGNHFRSELFTEDIGDTDGDFIIDAKWKSLGEWLSWLLLGGANLPPDSAREVGKELFSNLLGQPRNAKKWSEILQRAVREERPIRLLIDATTDGVRDLPFGLLCEPDHDFFLMRPGKNRPSIHFVRILRGCTPRSLNLQKKPLRVLVVAAEPIEKDIPGFDCSARIRQLIHAFAQCQFAVSICAAGAVDDYPSGALIELGMSSSEQFLKYTKTTREIVESALMSNRFDVLHVLAHGYGNGHSLLLCDANGRANEVTASDFSNWCGNELQLAVLQVCRAGRTDSRGGFGGLAQKLISPNFGNLAAVVASLYPLDAEKSTEALVRFYHAVASGQAPDQAIARDLPENDVTWAFLELWVRPGALGQTGSRGAFQFGSPYRGLSRFEERDADIFCGREAETAELVKILRDEPVVGVVGDSGTGKSSLLRAGIAHRVRKSGLAGLNEWTIVTLSPGETPTANLLSRLVMEDQQALLNNNQTYTADKLYEELCRACTTEKPLLVLFDQFEELFTVCQDDQERHAVASSLGRMAKQQHLSFRLVIATRGEYLTRIASLPILGDMVKRAWILKPPSRDKIRMIVREPAERQRYTFEGALDDGQPDHDLSLLDRILGDPLVTPSPSEDGSDPKATAPLPLLEFALERLWLHAVERDSYEFTHADYERIGGVAGAIAYHAEQVFAMLSSKLGEHAQAVAKKLLTNLVTARGSAQPR